MKSLLSDRRKWAFLPLVLVCIWGLYVPLLAVPVPLRGSFDVEIPCGGAKEAFYSILRYSDPKDPKDPPLEVLVEKRPMERVDDMFKAGPIYVLLECDVKEPEDAAFIVKADVRDRLIVIIEKAESLEYVEYTVVDPEPSPITIKFLDPSGEVIQTASDGIPITIQVEAQSENKTCDQDEIKLTLKVANRSWQATLRETDRATGVFETTVEVKIACKDEEDGLPNLVLTIGNKAFSPSPDWGNYPQLIAELDGYQQAVALPIENLKDALFAGTHLNPDCLEQHKPRLSEGWELLNGNTSINWDISKGRREGKIEMRYVMQKKVPWGILWGFAYGEWEIAESELVVKQNDSIVTTLTMEQPWAPIPWPAPEYTLELHTWLTDPEIKVYVGIVGDSESSIQWEPLRLKRHCQDEEGRNVYVEVLNPDSHFKDFDLQNRKIYVSWTNPLCPEEDFDLFIGPKQ